MVGFGLTPANGSEREVAEGLLGEHGGQHVLGDNGYSGERYRKDLSEQKRHQIWANPRPSPKPSSREEAQARRWLRANRDLIETVIGMLADQFTLETTRARSLWGMMTRLEAKLLAFNLSILLNQMLGRPRLALKDLYL